MAQIWGSTPEQVLADPLTIARAAARELGAIVTLKGAQTFVVAPDGRAFHNTAGNIGLGTSGSGDALSGVIAGLSARGASALQAAVWGVYLHAKAGDVLARRMGPLGFLAREVLTEIPSLLKGIAHSRA
jgi:NAD(P)H-hydrate repair Nnr-like enzyme with NAD(P)H-hydrate dehydratase domain